MFCKLFSIIMKIEIFSSSSSLQNITSMPHACLIINMNSLISYNCINNEILFFLSFIKQFYLILLIIRIYNLKIVSKVCLIFKQLSLVTIYKSSVIDLFTSMVQIIFQAKYFYLLYELHYYTWKLVMYSKNKNVDSRYPVSIRKKTTRRRWKIKKRGHITSGKSVWKQLTFDELAGWVLGLLLVFLRERLWIIDFVFDWQVIA